MTKPISDMTESELALEIARIEYPDKEWYIDKLANVVLTRPKPNASMLASGYGFSIESDFDPIWQRDKAAVLGWMVEEPIKNAMDKDSLRLYDIADVFYKYKSATLKDLAVMWVGWKHRDGCEV